MSLYSHLKEERGTYLVGAACAGVIYFLGCIAGYNVGKVVEKNEARNIREIVVIKERDIEKRERDREKKDSPIELMISGKCPYEIFKKAFDSFVIEPMEFSDIEAPFCGRAFQPIK